jgi:molybdopterin-guanine dinucleotide biosynthesis protein A
MTNCKNTQVVGVFLAGGQSKRMGCCKAQLRWQGRTLLQHQTNIFRQLCIPYYVSGPKTLQESGIEDDLSLCSDKCTPNRLGPLLGIASCLQALPFSRLLFIPIDMPLLNTKLLQHLIDHCGIHSEGKLREDNTLNTSVYYQGYPLPCLIHNTQITRQSAVTLLQSPGPRCSIKQFLRCINARQLPLTCSDNVNINAQVNTPEQWLQLQQLAMEC